MVSWYILREKQKEDEEKDRRVREGRGRENRKECRRGTYTGFGLTESGVYGGKGVYWDWVFPELRFKVLVSKIIE